MSDWSAEWVGTFWRVHGPWRELEPSINHDFVCERPDYRLPPRLELRTPQEAIEFMQAQLIADQLLDRHTIPRYLERWELKRPLLRGSEFSYPVRF